MESRHTMQELYQYQALPLEKKIDMTIERIKGWVNRYGEDGVYVSFSGGKDSTVLLDIVRNRCGFKNVPAVFVDVPTQYPELKAFADSFDNVVVIKPKISFMQVCEKYGFPLISKEVSECVQGARKYLTSMLSSETVLQTDRQTDRQAPVSVQLRQNCWSWSISETSRTKHITCICTKHRESLERADRASIMLGSRGGTTTSIVNYEELANIINSDKRRGQKVKTAILLGMLTTDNKIKANIPSGDRSTFSQEKYKFFLDAPFEISNKCCNVMKKEPAHRYTKETGRMPMTAQMASESRLRTQKWLQNGCNAFDIKNPISNPMSFWLEQDVLTYIYENNIEICSVYGDIVVDYDAMGQVDGQMNLSDFGIFDKERPALKCTGCNRTGCMLCGFGCHLEKPGEGRFEKLKQTHPKMYDLLDVVKNNGVTMREAIEWVNEHGNLNIRL